MCCSKDLAWKGNP
ncbi:hypothetical protein F383_38955 [Gossypium arboreum]|uniref:Uncharacterized protein n=1 Tax=Gossypium arboreum TaxID=29729 RepID=A0A0B0MNB8_GOSAR|nr:hypothetical protein F383_38955 [Gossypium arboreum]